MNIFLFDNERNEIVINEPEILLIKEFAALWNDTRNITKEDKTGKSKTRAYREFTYMYLMIDWQSPYCQDSEQDRHTAALLDAKLTEPEFDDPLFREACRKYRSIQESDRAIRLVKAAQNKCDELTDYFDSGSDLMERDPLTGKPVFKAKDVMGELAGVDKLLDSLEALEKRVKEKKRSATGLRGNKKGGFTPTGF